MFQLDDFSSEQTSFVLMRKTLWKGWLSEMVEFSYAPNQKILELFSFGENLIKTKK